MYMDHESNILQIDLHLVVELNKPFRSFILVIKPDYSNFVLLDKILIEFWRCWLNYFKHKLFCLYCRNFGHSNLPRYVQEMQ